MSYVVVGIVWGWILNWDWGAVNTLLRAVGLGRLGAALAGHSPPRRSRR